MTAPRVMSTEYIEWAKLRSQARFNLATSGVMNFPLKDLGVSLDQLEISGPSWYGYAPLQQALAKKCGVSTDNVVAAIGTSMANFLAMAAVIEPGDEVLIEHPAYDPVINVALYLGANVTRFPRRFANQFRIEPAEIARRITPRTRLIALTNLHNPTGVLTDEHTLREIGAIARRAGAHILVDEVYLEMLATLAMPVEPRSAFHLGEEFIATSSLTKAYGLSGLRCGWILASADLAKKMWRLNDLFGNIPAHTAELLSVIALERLPQIAARSAALLQKNRALLDKFLDSRTDLDVVRPPCGTIVFPRLASVGATRRVAQDPGNPPVLPACRRGSFAMPKTAETDRPAPVHSEPSPEAPARPDQPRGTLESTTVDSSEMGVSRPSPEAPASGDTSAARADEFFTLLREKYELSVVPGKFFEMPEHFRIGIGGDTATLDAALTRLSDALDSLS